jgi:hypothetical protein
VERPQRLETIYQDRRAIVDPSPSRIGAMFKDRATRPLI